MFKLLVGAMSLLALMASFSLPYTEQHSFGYFNAKHISKSSPSDSTYITLELYGSDKMPLDVQRSANISIAQYKNRSEAPHEYKVLVANKSIPRFVYVQYDDRYPIYFKTNIRQGRDVVYRLYLARSN